MRNEAIVCHRTADRIRLRIPSRKGEPGFFAQIRTQLETIPGINRVETSSLTGRVLLLCRESSESVLAMLRHDSILNVCDGAPVRRPLAIRTVEGFREVDDWVERSTGGELDLPGLALMGLLIAGIYQILRGNLTAPAWYTAFWYAASIALKAVPNDEKRELT